MFLVTVRDAAPAAGGNPSVAGREAGRPWKLATADACRWLPLLSPGSADPRRCLAGRLDRDQLAELDRMLDAGPAAAGREDQRWTLVRVRDLIGRKFGF